MRIYWVENNSRVHRDVILKNARFSVDHAGSAVILTLRPGQSLSWGHYYNHEEGWSSEGCTWRYRDGKLHVEHDTDGTDCDGRLSTHVELVADVPASGAFPHWDEVNSGQRDYAAEAAGY